MKSLKPVIFIQGERNFYRQNIYAQNLLLKALSDGITDPQELKRVAGLKTVAEVYRTLDKMAIRKEFHEALARNDISLDYIVNGLKKICDESRGESIRLKGFQTLLRSIGLDRYEKQEDTGKGWEETLLQTIEDDKKKLIEGEVVKAEFEEYEVKAPSIPKEELESQKQEKKVGKELYE